jgi:hypothetical protein
LMNLNVFKLIDIRVMIKIIIKKITWKEIEVRVLWQFTIILLSENNARSFWLNKAGLSLNHYFD